MSVYIKPGGGATLTASQVTGLHWNPVSTDWKVMWNDFSGPRSSGTLGYSGGTIGFNSVIAGSGSTTTPTPTAYADRYGVLKCGIGSAAGAIAGVESSHSDSTYRFGDGRIKFGAAIKLNDLPAATTADFDMCVGMGNNVTTFASEACYWYCDVGTNATNWLLYNNGTSTSLVDSTVALATDWVNLEIDVAADLSSVKFYMNGTLYHTETNSANIPAAGTECNFQIAARATAMTATKVFEIDWAYVAIKPTNTRGDITTWVDEL